MSTAPLLSDLIAGVARLESELPDNAPRAACFFLRNITVEGIEPFLKHRLLTLGFRPVPSYGGYGAMRQDIAALANIPSQDLPDLLVLGLTLEEMDPAYGLPGWTAARAHGELEDLWAALSASPVSTIVLNTFIPPFWPENGVGAALGGALAVTLPLVLFALILATAIGGGLGWAAALRSGSLTDRLLAAVAEIGAAVANFWLGLLLVLGFAGGLHWLPAAGFVPWTDDALQAIVSLLLPALALALPAAAAIALDARAALSEARQSLPVEAAQLRGLDAETAFRRHGLRLALLELSPALALHAAALIAGAMIVEAAFSLPGLGRLILDAVSAHDAATLRAGLLVLVLLIAGTVFLVRVCAGSADPRLTAETPE